MIRLDPPVFDADADCLHIAAMMECDDRAPGADYRQSLVGNDLKFHLGLMGSAMQLGSIEQLHVGDSLRAA